MTGLPLSFHYSLSIFFTLYFTKSKLMAGSILLYILSEKSNPLSANPTKWSKNSQTIRRQIADEFFECV